MDRKVVSTLLSRVLMFTIWTYFFVYLFTGPLYTNHRKFKEGPNKVPEKETILCLA